MKGGAVMPVELSSDRTSTPCRQDFLSPHLHDTRHSYNPGTRLGGDLQAQGRAAAARQELQERCGSDGEAMGNGERSCRGARQGRVHYHTPSPRRDTRGERSCPWKDSEHSRRRGISAWCRGRRGRCPELLVAAWTARLA